MALHVLDEANRCLGCKKPLCQQGCPIHTNIPEVIRCLLYTSDDRLCAGMQPREPVRRPLCAQPDAQPRPGALLHY